MTKHRHNEFQSDIFLLFETVGAQLTIMFSNNNAQIVTMTQFLKMDMKKKLIKNVMLPPLNKTYRLTTFKVMPRSQNAHAIVNSGFLYKLTPENIAVQARIVFGGLSPSFVRASSTERFLIGKPLFKNETLQAAINSLKDELVVTENPPEESVAYRKKLALGLFYKGLLTLCPESIIHPRYKSGRIKIHESRPVSKGQQMYETDPSTWPLNQPIPKMEGLIQCAGEAMYTDDIPPFPNEVYAAFVLSTIGKGQISSIDATEALNHPGVIAFFSAKDIPGLNSFTPAEDENYQMNEEVFCSGDVKYYNQPVALIVADSQETANLAANFVKIEYINVGKPVVDVKLAKKDPKRNKLNKEIRATHRGQDIAKVVKGDNTIYGQYHFPLETLVSVSKPSEEGLAVYATTQWTSAIQLMVSRALKLDQSRIDVHVRRIGGAFGIKISRIIQTAVATSLVAMKLNIPCRIIHPLETNTRALGKRFPCSSNFEAGVNKYGIIQYVNHDVYEDNGYERNEIISDFGVIEYNNCYNDTIWNHKCIDTITDTAKNTWARSPGTMEQIAVVELIMEQISYELSIDPVQIRLKNLDPKHSDLIEMYQTLKTNSDYETRRLTVNRFNMENRWKKRGLRFVFLRWEHIYARYFDVNLAVFQGDGTIVISHGGAEIGQGINTKAAQIAAYMLGVPIDKIIIKENNTIVSPNSNVSGGSLTTQNIIMGVEKCCVQLLARLEPIRKQMQNPSWEELIKKSFEKYVDLQAHGFTGENDIQNYTVYGVTLAEVEIDVLTGESEILRVDILQDVGRSINPAIDIGQVPSSWDLDTGPARNWFTIPIQENF
ncbi:xanthine dehydrogenase-like [Trichoplusia ni]|uniref:Xanthine dehydrogenase-like n=1 Tax=Trichoplusia ni TaxID=7111 RepID=A0A7E5WMF4_TRINI|nr:xanthine dehydrogenase-like [Trichoplusia ni]